MRGLPILAVAAALAAVGPAAAQGDPKAGLRIAEQNCAACHALGPTGASPIAEAPPFRDLHRRYAVEDLAEALAEGIVTGHPAMPEFQLDPLEIDHFMAYLKSLER
ncbi:MAG TPA: c-type cytochrome [Beijerinckiaceae bacterium]|nr:c-type cytochrome [Beijerinckiaceae bacterium]